MSSLKYEQLEFCMELKILRLCSGFGLSVEDEG